MCMVSKVSLLLYSASFALLASVPSLNFQTFAQHQRDKDLCANHHVPQKLIHLIPVLR